MAAKNKQLSNIIKYQCDKCRYVKRKTRREAAKEAALGVTKTLLSSLGVVLILMTIVAGPIALTETVVNQYLFKSANLDNDELRRVAINASSHCVDGFSTNSYCYGYWIFDYLNDTRYVPASNFKPMNSITDTYEYGSDCKNMAVLYAAMMKSVGFEATIECDAEHGHCINLVPHYDNFERQEGYVVVDLTIPGYYAMESFTNPWDYLSIGRKIESGRT